MKLMLVTFSLLQDVKSVTWRLKTDQDGNIQSINERGAIQSNYAGLKAVLDRRREFYKEVRSMSIQGVPVTQPSENPENVIFADFFLLFLTLFLHMARS